MQNFRVYYADGSTVDDDFDALKPFGVLCILIQRGHDNRWGIIHGSPYYAHNGKEWMVFQLNDVVDYLVHKLPINHFLVGQMVDKKVWYDTYERAKKDRDLLD